MELESLKIALKIETGFAQIILMTGFGNYQIGSPLNATNFK